MLLHAACDHTLFQEEGRDDSFVTTAIIIPITVIVITSGTFIICTFIRHYFSRRQWLISLHKLTHFIFGTDVWYQVVSLATFAPFLGGLTTLPSVLCLVMCDV